MVLYRFSILITLFFFTVLTRAQEEPGRTKKKDPPRLLDVRRIWDQAPHNAFTDLIRFQDRWFCVFREGEGHVSPEGALRVISSADGQQWESAALIRSSTMDLRDAKLSITAAGELMLLGAGALHDKSLHTHQSLVWFSRDGYEWTEVQQVGHPDFWLWRVSWHQGIAYGFAYGCRRDNYSSRLYVSTTGRDFHSLIGDVFGQGEYTNESAIVFANDTAYCLLRRDQMPNTGLWGVSSSPYVRWNWRDTGTRIGGPHLISLPDGRMVAAVRLYDKRVRTALCWVEKDTGQLNEFLTLPSGGDTSYAGLALHGGLLWISYYSSHEGKTSIYLAKVKL